MNVPIEKICPVVNSPLDKYRGRGIHTIIPRKERKIISPISIGQSDEYVKLIVKDNLVFNPQTQSG